ncbi:hypothetical protein J4Q44_G00132940 [Coregonus suidteri]|uniref:DUF4806 domain-containing protein n=1 Tax=Coregonus suidteri TaxID=861788 RepID=A0AAN8QTC4_9TELE
MSSLEDLRRVEVKLSDQDLKNDLTIYLGLSGGMTTKENVWRILSKLLTNGLAMKKNWRGANGKQAFEPLALKSVVIVPDVEIEKYIKRWKQLAPDRDGVRKRRERVMENAYQSLNRKKA